MRSHARMNSKIANHERSLRSKEVPSWAQSTLRLDCESSRGLPTDRDGHWNNHFVQLPLWRAEHRWKAESVTNREIGSQTGEVSQIDNTPTLPAPAARSDMQPLGK